MSKILVTGGAGFIGSHLVDRLVEREDEVVVVDNSSNGKRAGFSSKPKDFVGRSICGGLDDLFEKEKFDYVFHFAAKINVRESFQNPIRDFETNILGSTEIIGGCVRHNVKKIIFPSSAAVYSSSAAVPCDEDSPKKPESPYGLSKLFAEQYLEMVSGRGLNSAVLRFSNVYGGRQCTIGEGGVVGIFSEKAISNEPLKVFGDGEQTRDFIYVDDVVNACIYAALAENIKGVYNVSTGLETKINVLADKIRKIVGSKSDILHVDAVRGEIRRSALSPEKISELGWKADVSLDDGLKRTLDWYRAHMKKST